MGRVLLVGRLAVRDLRRRPAEAALLLLAITAATATLTLGLVLRGVTDKPYDKTREATNGPDVVASADATPPELGGQPANLAALESLTRASGVTSQSGPFPVAWTTLTADGEIVNVRAEGRDTEPAPVDQPKLTQGSWVRDGGVVVEGAFADALGIGAGDRITLNGRTFRVVGVAVTAAAAPYPDSCLGFCGPSPSDAGLVWLTRADARSLASDARSLSYVSYQALSALARALGATPEQVSAGLSAAQVLPALAGAALGIPGGIGLFAATSDTDTIVPPLWQLLAVMPGTVLVVAGLTAIPARLSARRRVAEILAAERA